jgi:glycine cleavage system H lipoate-binding protein
VVNTDPYGAWLIVVELSNPAGITLLSNGHCEELVK